MTLVARRRVGVGPGVKMEVQRDSRKDAMFAVERSRLREWVKM